MKALYFENKIVRVAALKAATLINRYAALGRFSPLVYGNVEEPQLPDARWLKVRNISCGLCGTDLHFMFMDMDPKCFPAAVPGITRKFLGHELISEVIEVGDEAGDFHVGDRVTMRIDWPSCFQMEIDPPCRQCGQGNYMLCENLGSSELPLRDVGGGFSPFMVMHRSQPYKIPDSVNNDEALLMEPLASSVHGVLKAEPQSGDKVLVVGAGSIGLLTVAAARAFQPEAKVYCLARHPFQAETAEKLGAEILKEGKDLYPRIADATGARYVKGYFGNEILLGGFDRVYDTVGNDRSLNLSLRAVRGGGDVVLIGINFKPGKIDYSAIWNQEIRLTGINCHSDESLSQNSFDIAAGLLEEKLIDPADFITHRYPMTEYKEAVKTFLNKKESRAVKIVLDHSL